MVYKLELVPGAANTVREKSVDVEFKCRTVISSQNLIMWTNSRSRKQPRGRRGNQRSKGSSRPEGSVFNAAGEIQFILESCLRRLGVSRPRQRYQSTCRTFLASCPSACRSADHGNAPVNFIWNGSQFGFEEKLKKMLIFLRVFCSQHPLC